MKLAAPGTHSASVTVKEQVSEQALSQTDMNSAHAAGQVSGLHPAPAHHEMKTETSTDNITYHEQRKRSTRGMGRLLTPLITLLHQLMAVLS